MKILILGHGRHGKDTVADMITELYGYTFLSSSHACAEVAVYPVLAPIYGYRTLEECYEDRVNHRKEWRQLISDYNTPDKTKLARHILSQCDGYVGLRCPLEFGAARHLFDVTVWVDAFRRVPELDKTMGIAQTPDMFFIDNNGTPNQTKKSVEAIFSCL